MNQYFAHLRVSATKQGELGVSLPQQREAIERSAPSGAALEICRWLEEQENAPSRKAAILRK
jgi:hypothetical protein